MRSSDSTLSDAREKMIAMENEMKKVIVGIDHVVRLLTLAVFSRGHVLLDGLPGVAKTLLCFAIARTVGGEMIKFEGRPDFMPTQFLYMTEPDERGDPKFYKTQLITRAERISVTLLDEITRFMPQTQAFWFEIMNEFRLTLPSGEVQLPHNRVFATKNKVTRGETSEIPQPQLDRFLINVEVGYPDPEAEKKIIMDEHYDDPVQLVRAINKVVDLEELEAIVAMIQSRIYMSPTMIQYFSDVTQATRFPSRYGITLEGVRDIDSLVDIHRSAAGISPRGAAKWRRIAKVYAFHRGSDSVTPEDAIAVAEETLAHRIFVNEKAAQERNRSLLARDFLRAIFAKVAVPAASEVMTT